MRLEDLMFLTTFENVKVKQFEFNENDIVLTEKDINFSKKKATVPNYDCLKVKLCEYIENNAKDSGITWSKTVVGDRIEHYKSLIPRLIEMHNIFYRKYKQNGLDCIIIPASLLYLFPYVPEFQFNKNIKIDGPYIVGSICLGGLSFDVIVSPTCPENTVVGVTYKEDTTYPVACFYANNEYDIQVVDEHAMLKLTITED